MADSTPDDRQLDELIGAVLDGSASETQLEKLNVLMASDPAVVERWLELSELHVLSHRLLGQPDQLIPMSPHAGSTRTELPAMASLDAKGLMQQLVDQTQESCRLAEAAARAERELQAKQEQLDHDARRGRQVPGLSGSGMLFIPQPLAWAGLAAAVVLLLVMVSFVVRSSGDDRLPQTPVAAQDGNKPQPQEQAVAAATLTAEYDAHWVGSAPRVGEALHAGLRLTLDAGRAEVTTLDGAIAVLEAPCSFEMIDRNAMLLHNGSMVGICETEAAQGFLVRTPSMDVIDLGTRFGVEASAEGEAQVHVIEGLVKAVASDAPQDTEPVLLSMGESARVSERADAIIKVELDSDRYAPRMPPKIQLLATGHGLTINQIDPNWQIVEIDGALLDRPQALRVESNAVYRNVYAKLSDRVGSTQHIAWMPDQQPEKVGGFITYTFRTHVSIPDSIDPETAEISLRCVADNQLLAIRVNGETIPISTPEEMDQYKKDIVNSLVLNQHLAAGLNKIEFVVANHALPEAPGAGFVGLMLTWELTGEPRWR
jgi:hypothetical protein